MSKNKLVGPDFGLNSVSFVFLIKVACVFLLPIYAISARNTADSKWNILQILLLVAEVVQIIVYFDICSIATYRIFSFLFTSYTGVKFLAVSIQSIFAPLWIYMIGFVLSTVIDLVLCRMHYVAFKTKFHEQFLVITKELEDNFGTHSNYDGIGAKMQRDEYVEMEIPLHKISEEASFCVPDRVTVKGGVCFFRDRLQYYVLIEECRKVAEEVKESRNQCIALSANNSLLRGDQNNAASVKGKQNGREQRIPIDVNFEGLDLRLDACCKEVVHFRVNNRFVTCMTMEKCRELFREAKKVLDKEFALREENALLMESAKENQNRRDEMRSEETKKKEEPAGTTLIDDVD